MQDIRVRPAFQQQSPEAKKANKKFRLASISSYRPSKRTLQYLAVVFLIVVGIVFTRNYIQTRDELKRATDPAAAAKAEALKLASQLDDFLDLPANDTPSLATVKNVNQLKGQAFFESAQNGDKVLIYPNAKVAVLYRPTTNKIIIFAPVSDSQTQ